MDEPEIHRMSRNTSDEPETETSEEPEIKSSDEPEIRRMSRKSMSSDEPENVG